MIVIADLHIGRKTDSVTVNERPSRYIDIENRLNEVLEEAVRRNESNIVVAGDIFDRVHPRVEAIGIYGAFLAGCRAENIMVYHIPGNHDCDIRLSNTQMFSSFEMDHVIEVMVPVTVDIDGMTVAFFPHLPRHELDAIEAHHGSYSKYFAKHIQEVFDPDVIIGHAMLKGYEYSNDVFFESANAMEFDTDSLGSFGSAILGHIHDHKSISASKGRVTYPGSLVVNNFGEIDDEKGFMVVSKGVEEWVPFKSEVTPYVRVDIDLESKDEVDLSPDTIREIVEGAIVKVVVHARSRAQVDERAIKNAINKYGHVSRFEVEINHESESRKRADGESREAIKTNLDHEKLLDEYIGETKAQNKVKELARSIGGEVISEVRND